MRNKILTAIFAVTMGSFLGVLSAHSSGADPRHTAAPGDADQLACATAGCHTSSLKGGPLNAFGGSVAATFSQGSTYTPGGDPITILVHVQDPSQANAQHGFQMTARPESNPAHGQAGSFKSGSGTFVLCDNGSPRPTSGSSAGKCSTNGGFDPIEFMDHSAPSTSTWTFTWTPPATDIGNVHFYLAGNAVNGNGTNDGGDHVYISDYALSPIGTCSADTPSLTGVISPGGFGGRGDFSPGTWLEVYGANISSAVKNWQRADFAETIAPTTLDRVTVTVNGKPAFIDFAGSGQVNVQAPADTANGPVKVTVTNCGRTSNAITLNETPVAPAILAPGSFVVGGHQLIGATLSDLQTFVGVIPGVTSRAVKPGETIITYGVGFGDVTPAVAPGAIALVQNKLVAPLNVTIGGVTVAASAIGYAGLSPGYVGLYQFNIVVPNVPDGDQPITFQAGGVSINQPALYLTVKH